MPDIAELRAEARELGINSFGKGKAELQEEIATVKGVTTKKGKASWKPARMLDIRNQQAGYRHRWVSRDSQRVEKMLAEGWVIVDKTSGIKGEHADPNTVQDGNALEGANVYRELVHMALPDELGEARDEYYQQKAKAQVEGVNRRAREEAKKIDPRAHVHNAKLIIE